MTTSNAVSNSAMGAQAVVTADVSWVQHLYWSIRRELWENRSIYIAPVAVAIFYCAGFLMSTIAGLQMVSIPYDLASVLVMATMSVVAVFYSLDALYGERRDRSILFWKSMPVSDLTAVLSKAFIPIVLIPLLTFVITVTIHLLMLLVSSVFGNGISLEALFHKWMVLLYHLVTVHALWYAPIFGWLLLVSAWARRTPFLWASLPLIALWYIERMAFGTAHFSAMLASRVTGGTEGAAFMTDDGMTSHIAPDHFLMSPGLWIGLALTALFLAAAVRLRRSGA
jgi:ABC-2 type transport system permease protein